MNDQSDERVDELLRRHLAEQLDRHVGAASERFRRHIDSAPAGTASLIGARRESNGAAPLRIDALAQPSMDRSQSALNSDGGGGGGSSGSSGSGGGGPRVGSLWAIGIVGGALAAAVTLVSLRHTILPTSKRPARPQIVDGGRNNRDVIPDGQMPMSAQQASLDVAWKTVDQGLVPLEDGSPARRLLQQRTDTIKWYDAKRKAQIEYTVPREQTVYVGYKAN